MAPSYRRMPLVYMYALLLFACAAPGSALAGRGTTMMQLHLMQNHRLENNARCLDGSAGGFYLDVPANRTADPGAWHIHFEGGGWW